MWKINGAAASSGADKLQLPHNGALVRRTMCWLALALCLVLLSGETHKAEASVAMDTAPVMTVAYEDDGPSEVALRDLSLRGGDHSFDAAGGTPHIPTFTLREIAVSVLLLVLGALVAFMSLARGDGDGFDQL